MKKAILVIAAAAICAAAPASARFGDVSFTAQTRFESNMRMELNQQKSLLFPTALKRDVAGAEKTKLDNLISNSKARRKTARGETHQQDTTGFDGIWVAKDDPYYLATFQDTEDKLLTAVDLKGAETMNHAGTIARAKDTAFLYGFYGDMITGKQGTVVNAFPAANIVPVTLQPDGTTGAACGMNVQKVRRARRFLARNYVDMSQTFYLALTSIQVEELTLDAKAIDRDYADSGQAGVVGRRQAPDLDRRLHDRRNRAQRTRFMTPAADLTFDSGQLAIASARSGLPTAWLRRFGRSCSRR
jgi:hypothetical protein